MDAYKSMYEHHQKDADGNTIPHEEELNEMRVRGGWCTVLFAKTKTGKSKR